MLVGVLTWAAAQAYTKIFQTTIDLFPDPAKTDLIFVLLGYLAIALVAMAVVGLFALLLVRRDLTAAYVVVAGSGLAKLYDEVVELAA